MDISDTVRQRLIRYAPQYYDKYFESDERQDIIREIKLDTMGGDIIGSGAGRNVFDMDVLGYPEYCLKLATPQSRQHGGIQQNKREQKVWREADSQEREYLVPVVDSGSDFYWLVMLKGESDSTPTYGWRSEAKYALSNLVWEDEFADENIVKLNGEYRLCDYGTPPQSSKS